jgi:hypothetical protein
MFASMAVVARRGLSPAFMDSLQSGVLAPLCARVRRDRSLCLALRENSINVYYRGGNLLRVSEAAGGYAAFFDLKYLEGAEAPIPMPPGRISAPHDVTAWLSALPWLKQWIDLFLGRQAKEEREVQQALLRDNNFGRCARSTDYYVCDIEYATAHGRFDVVAVHWPSTPAERKRQERRRLVLAEIKFGDAALDGPAGLHAHIHDVNAHLADPENVVGLKLEMVRVFNQKRALGLIDCDKDLLGFSDDPPVLLLVLANHDPDKARLRELLGSLPPSPHAELRIATSCLFGYGLYDPALLSIEQLLTRFAGCI